MQGWKNEQTWRVALQLRNTPELYQTAQRCREGTYLEFLSRAPLDQLTGGVAWWDESLDVTALNNLVRELRTGVAK